MKKWEGIVDRFENSMLSTKFYDKDENCHDKFMVLLSVPILVARSVE